jgi:hypothetical protein
MRYLNGPEARLGDRVRIKDTNGTVVICVDTDEYHPDFSRDEWGDLLQDGVLVEFEVWGLVHCIEPDEDLEFCARGDIEHKRTEN